MNTWTDEEKARAKALAAEKLGSDRMLVINIGDPIDFSVLACCHDRASFATYWDGTIAAQQNAHRGAMTGRVVAPDLGVLEKKRQTWAAFAQTISIMLAAEAGVGSPATIEPLDLAAWDTAEKAAAVAKDGAAPVYPLGLERAKAEELIKAAAGRALWTVDSGDSGLRAVLETPISDVWLAFDRAHDVAVSKRKGVIATLDAYVLPAVKWSSEPLDGGAGLLDRKPGLVLALEAAYRKAGGDGARVRTEAF